MSRSHGPWCVLGALLLGAAVTNVFLAPRLERDDALDDATERALDGFERAVADAWDRDLSREEPRPGAAPDPRKPVPVDRSEPPVAPPAPGRVPPPWAPTTTPMDEARGCLRVTSNNVTAGHQCVVQVLRGHATTEPEWGLLVVTYRSLGQDSNAARAVREYLARFPEGPRAAAFRADLDSR